MRTRRFLTIVPLVMLLYGVSLEAVELPFGAATELVTDFTWVRDLEAADLNGDGTMDIVACAESHGSVYLWSGTGGGAFSRSTIASGLDSPTTLAVGDVDEDGDLDVVLGQSNNVSSASETEVMWFENPTIGANTSWTSHQVYSYSDNGIWHIALADLDGDHDLDIVVSTGVNSVGMDWLENDGTPASGAWGRNVIQDVGSFGFAIVDIDGDGDLDIAGAYFSADSAVWWEHDGVPTDHWTMHVVKAGVGTIRSVDCGDITGNGKVEIVAAGPGYDHIYWFEFSGSAWTSHTLPFATNEPESVEVVDMDFDGDQDILAALFYGAKILWYENTDGEGGSWTEREIDGSFGSAVRAVAADLDGDGDLDVAAGSTFDDMVTWYENHLIHREFENAEPVVVRSSLAEPRALEMADVNGDGRQDMVVGLWEGNSIFLYLGLPIDPIFWLEITVVSGGFLGVRDVSVADMNGDGHLDVIGAAVFSDQVWWWENDGGITPSFTSHMVLNPPDIDGAHQAEPADIDCDGDMDLVVTAVYGDEVMWMENTNGLGTAWTKHFLLSADGAHDVAVGDLDGDGMPDIVATGYYGNGIVALLNPIGGAGPWTVVVVDLGINGPRGVDLADLDGDGDLDIGGVVRNDNKIFWYENNGTGGIWTKHNVGSGLLIDGAAIRLTDLDHDGDADVVATSQSQGDVCLWFNNGDATSWSYRKMESSLASPWDVVIADVDDDGRRDIAVAAGGSADSLSWYRNVGGQADVAAWATAPSEILDGEQVEILMFTIWHRGRPSWDGDLRPVNIQIHLKDDEGTSLTTTQANAVIEELEFYQDTDLNGVPSGGDTLILTDTYLTLSLGAVRLNFQESLTAQEVAPGQGKTFFVMMRATADASAQATEGITATLMTSQLGVEDVTWDVSLAKSPGNETTTNVIQFIDDGLIFADDFESGNLLSWS